MAHKPYGLNELREMYLKFFETKGHLRLPSFSLVPQNDKSILLINAGMTPMKPWFTGEEEPPRHRVTTCQKCIRTGDIENVGHTARHGTYFEMLGNFSFGDYFKKEAIPWAWEFLTSPDWVGLEPDRLYPSVFAGNETTASSSAMMHIETILTDFGGLTLENEEDVFKEPEETCEAEAREAMEEEEAWMTAVFVAFRDDSVQVARGRGVTSVVLRVRFHEDSSLFLHAGASRQHGTSALRLPTRL